MKGNFLLVFLCAFTLLNAQTRISGTITADSDAEALAFVNVGIKNKNIGTVSSERGVFSILIPDESKNDTLSFSLIGYRVKSIPIAEMSASKPAIIRLSQTAIHLTQVDVTARKLKEVKRGITRSNPALHIIDASMNHSDIFEIGQRIRLGESPAQITSINLLINEPGKDSGVFRINFYKYDGAQPGENLINQSIVEKKAIREGWLSFDLKRYNIFLKGEVVAAIEFMPSASTSAPIKYEVRIGGTSRSFQRTASLGAWQTPPHHYRMFVTTLEDLSQKNEETEEKDLRPQQRVFSASVNDSFSLFIHLPKDYRRQKEKAYPVLFLLDGNVYFELMVNSIERLSFRKKIKEAIVVGIGYRNFSEADSLRDRDYTYPVALPKDSFRISGGAANFLAFIETELGPWLDKNYRTDPGNRTLMGHSLGGYFALFALQKQLRDETPFFRNYIAASPSLLYGDTFLLSKFRDLDMTERNGAKLQLLLSRGALEPEDAPAFEVFSAILAEEKFKMIDMEKIIWRAADHMATAIPSFEAGLEMSLK